MEEDQRNREDNSIIIQIKNGATKNGGSISMRLSKETIFFFKSFLLYLIMLFGGALFFYLMESRNEISNIDAQIEDILDNKEKIMGLLNTSIEAGDISKNEELFINLQAYSTGFDDFDTIKRKWTFINSLLFSFTILTTIGYGRYAPLTTGGRVFLMIYAIIGIPLTAVCLSRGAERFIYVYKWISQINIDKIEKAFSHYDENGSGELDEDEFNNALKSLGFELTTHELDQLWNSIDFDGSGTLDVEEFRRVVKDLNFDLTDAAGKNKEARITIIAILTFLALGVLIFSFTEKWSPFISFYFLIVSLTTIGLGDFIPQTHTGGVLLLIYAAIGLGLIATGLTVLESQLYYMNAKNQAKFENMKEKKQMGQKIEQIPNFSSINHKKLRKLMESNEVLHIDPNFKIFEKGTKLDKIYFLAKGSICAQSSDESEESVQINAGSLLFESSISNNLRTDYYVADATIFATTNVKMQSLYYHKINEALESDSKDENNSLVLSTETKSELKDISDCETHNANEFDSVSIDLKENEVHGSNNETNEKRIDLLSQLIWSYGVF